MSLGKKGFSLIELAFCILIISIAIIPVIMVTTGSQRGKTAALGTLLSQESSVVSSLMEQATTKSPEFYDLILSSNVFNQKDNSSEIKTSIKNYPDSRLYYRWVFKNLTYTGPNSSQVLPDGNYLIDTALEIFNEESLKINQTPRFTIATKILIQKPQETFKEPMIGIMILLDMTPSMAASNYEWKHTPIRTLTSGKYKEAKGVSLDKIPIFNENTHREQIINFVGQFCSPNIQYGGNFGFPYYENYNSNDFSILDHKKLDEINFKDNYIPAPSIINLKKIHLASPYNQEKARLQVQKLYSEISPSVLNTNCYTNYGSMGTGLSKIEALRSALYLFLTMIEKEKTGPRRYYKIGFLPFSNTVNTNYLLEPQGADINGQFSKLRNAIKSINRNGGPITYKFNLTNKTGNISTDFATALNTANNVLLKDKEITDRMIILITDWNPCTEIPKVADIEPTRACISKTIEVLLTEGKKIKELIITKKKNNPNYTPDENDPLIIKLHNIKTTINELSKFLRTIDFPDIKPQPYHNIYPEECLKQEKIEVLDSIAQNITEANPDKKTDLYIIGISDAARAPSLKILANMTAYSENGQYIKHYIFIEQIQDLFNYMGAELYRYLKIKESGRYKWLQKK